MFDRLVSLVMIFAVIACPMCCGNRACHADQCCATDLCLLGKQASPTCPIHRTIEGCFNETAQDHNGRDHRPCPEKSSCQGICGGAVFEKPCELTNLEAYFFSPWVDDNGSIVSLLAHFRTSSARDHHGSDATNHGRFVRTLHSSFLC